jgi:hypothetical protein
MMWRKALALMALVALAPARAGATATVAVTSVDRSDKGTVRIGVHYDGGQAPSFRLTPVCTSTEKWVVNAAVSVDPASQRATIEAPGDLSWFSDRRNSCQASSFNVEMLEGSDVVATTEVPIERATPRALVATPPPSEHTAKRFGVAGFKLRAPQTKMAQAGITFAFTNRLSWNLSYERTAYAPLARHDHDDGILTGLNIGF